MLDLNDILCLDEKWKVHSIIHISQAPDVGNTLQNPNVTVSISYTLLDVYGWADILVLALFQSCKTNWFDLMSCQWVSAPGKFTMDSVRPRNDNEMFLGWKSLLPDCSSSDRDNARIMSATSSLLVCNPPLSLPPPRALGRAPCIVTQSIIGYCLQAG